MRESIKKHCTEKNIDLNEFAQKAANNDFEEQNKKGNKWKQEWLKQ